MAREERSNRRVIRETGAESWQKYQRVPRTGFLEMQISPLRSDRCSQCHFPLVAFPTRLSLRNGLHYRSPKQANEVERLLVAQSSRFRWDGKRAWSSISVNTACRSMPSPRRCLTFTLSPSLIHVADFALLQAGDRRGLCWLLLDLAPEQVLGAGGKGNGCADGVDGLSVSTRCQASALLSGKLIRGRLRYLQQIGNKRSQHVLPFDATSHHLVPGNE